ncbi:uncharacterized protein LOC111829318 [Capsella rubella]|uniref:uncharacterized protein LOC111829318 n=1 Tax=Capsella rubella TaxID=81985 RepID=UPI000CD4EC88|nr:uncharacterized protein LOC111829318 [Capsella rubella]
MAVVNDPPNLVQQAMNSTKAMVWWDINSCPVPEGYDVSTVSRSIKLAMKHTGPLTITAIGNLKLILKEMPNALHAISSSGINLKHVPEGFRDIFEELIKWKRENPPPATIMVITGNFKEVKRLLFPLSNIEKQGYTFLPVFSQSASQSINAEEYFRNSTMCIWEQLLKDAIDSGDTRKQELEEKFCVTNESPCRFFCTLCNLAVPCVEDLCAHLKGRDHISLELDLVSGPLPKKKLVKRIFTLSKFINKQGKDLNESFEEGRLSL